MTALRLISLPVHGALEMLLGMTVMAAPFALGLSPAATVVAVFAGALAVGLALSAAAPDPARPALAVGTHHAFDHGLATGFFVAAALVGLAGDRGGAALLALAGLSQLGLNLTTRYSRVG